MTDRNTKTIKVNYLARVEGEGALHVRLRRGQVEDVQLKIFEPPRFFEAFLRGRSALEAPDITARICGICPVAYQMSAVYAVENALDVEVPASIHHLRRLLYCGEWIESHALHVHMLHAPDFLGFDDAVAMAKVHPKEVERGLAIKKAGNAIVALLGGREIHPINVRVGGFYRVPRAPELRGLQDDLERALEMACDAVHWVAGFKFPGEDGTDRQPELVALQPLGSDSPYPMCTGLIASSAGLALDTAGFESVFEEIHVPYTNALQAVIKGRGAYLTGPWARMHLNRARLSKRAQALLASGLFTLGERYNPFKSIIVRALEVVHALEEAINLIRTYRQPDAPHVPVTLRAGVGTAATEAPRGLLYHRYTLADDGTILDAKIVPPTSQNQKAIEDDVRSFLPGKTHLPRAELTHLCEQAIRNHDPCISCATHFLKLDVEDVDTLPRVER